MKYTKRQMYLIVVALAVIFLSVIFPFFILWINVTTAPTIIDVSKLKMDTALFSQNVYPATTVTE